MPIIDDAPLMQSECLRKLRLLFDDLPRSHNLVLIGQPPLMQTLALSINEDGARSASAASSHETSAWAR